MKDFAGRIAVVTGGGSGMGRELGDPDLSRGTESLQTRSLADGGTANTHKARSSDLGDSNPRSRIGAKLARKQFLHGPVGWSIAESVQAAAAESAIVIGPKRARPTSCDASPFCQSGPNSGLYS
jgi:NAD(P)-dependent dehydrogenase (short-subunit alcohol dehydrogenase family)